MELKDIDKTADTVLPQITTNIPAKEIRDLMIKYYDLKIDESVGWPYTWDGVQLNGVWYDAPITLSSNDKDLHKDIFGSKKYEPSQTVQNINQLIIDETGFDEFGSINFELHGDPNGQNKWFAIGNEHLEAGITSEMSMDNPFVKASVKPLSEGTGTVEFVYGKSALDEAPLVRLQLGFSVDSVNGAVIDSVIFSGGTMR